MNEADLLKGVVQLGQAGIFFWLYWDTNRYLKQIQASHEMELKRVYEMRVEELRLIARLPTDLHDPSLK